MCPKDVDGIANSVDPDQTAALGANSVDPDQTAPLGAVWSGSTLFAQTCLSENLGTIRYYIICEIQCYSKSALFRAMIRYSRIRR